MGREAQASATGAQGCAAPLDVTAFKLSNQINVVLKKNTFSLTLRFDSIEQVNDLLRNIHQAAHSVGG